MGISWGSRGTATLLTNADGLRLLPAGRNTDLPWLGIDKLTITLSQAEPLSAADVLVTGVAGGNYGPVSLPSLSSAALAFAQAAEAALH